MKSVIGFMKLLDSSFACLGACCRVCWRLLCHLGHSNRQPADARFAIYRLAFGRRHRHELLRWLGWCFMRYVTQPAANQHSHIVKPTRPTTRQPPEGAARTLAGRSDVASAAVSAKH